MSGLIFEGVEVEEERKNEKTRDRSSSFAIDSSLHPSTKRQMNLMDRCIRSHESSLTLKKSKRRGRTVVERSKRDAEKRTGLSFVFFRRKESGGREGLDFFPSPFGEIRSLTSSPPDGCFRPRCWSSFGSCFTAIAVEAVDTRRRLPYRPRHERVEARSRQGEYGIAVVVVVVVVV